MGNRYLICGVKGEVYKMTPGFPPGSLYGLSHPKAARKPKKKEKPQHKALGNIEEERREVWRVTKDVCSLYLHKNKLGNFCVTFVTKFKKHLKPDAFPLSKKFTKDISFTALPFLPTLFHRF